MAVYLEHCILFTCDGRVLDNEDCGREISDEASVGLVNDVTQQSMVLDAFIKEAVNQFENDGWHIDDEHAFCPECAVALGLTDPDDD